MKKGTSKFSVKQLNRGLINKDDFIGKCGACKHYGWWMIDLCHNPSKRKLETGEYELRSAYADPCDEYEEDEIDEMEQQDYDDELI